jgi:glyoxylase-like metal-dependent hydrolase (beta-lactamase superfamily II)
MVVLLIPVILFLLVVGGYSQKKRTAAPLPEAAKGKMVDPQKGYEVGEIRDGLYSVTDGWYNVIFLTTGKGVIVVDAPPSLAPNMMKAIREVTKEPVTHVIYSHSHGDHIGSASIYPADATIIAHEETANILARAKDKNRPVPEVTFKDTYTLKVGKQTLELVYPGSNHEPGNIIIYAPRQKVLMLVDVVFPGWVPFKNLALAEDIPGFIAIHDEVLTYDFQDFVGGHLNRLGSRKDVEIAREYVLDVKKNAAMALQTVNFMTVAQEVGFENPWLLFDSYFHEVAKTCADATLPNWVSRLGGADVFTDDHCLVMMESLRIDYNLVGGSSQ